MENHKILQSILKYLAQKTIKKYRPGIIGVTGSVGKTSTKLALYSILSSERKVRASASNFNNELGFPLVILGDYQKIKFPLIFWPKVILRSCFNLLFNVNYPEILILEYAANRPGDLKYLLDIAKPNIGIITAIGEIPAHLEFYSDPEEVAKEKSKLIEALGVNNFAVLNADDIAVMQMKDKTRAHIITFGFDDSAQIKITNFENIFNDEKIGIAFKLEYNGSFVPVIVDNILGKAHAYAIAAASATALIFGLNLVKISEALNNYRPLPSRMKVIRGIKNSIIIDDSYNASPISMQLALETLRGIKAKRKIAVLGDMLEIGKYTFEAHQKIGEQAIKSADVLIAIGKNSDIIAQAAQRKNSKEIKVYTFQNANEAIEFIKTTISAGDVILFKASHALNFEKIVKAISLE